MSALFPVLRWLLGLIMVATSADYFLQDLLPFLGPVTWHDPMAIQLVSALETSGLLAVAKAIQLAGGALLLFNRAVPFALAAMLCVDVCGAFIALLVEGNMLLCLASLAVLALNGVLMLGYLPAYRGVLAQDVLADGEGWDEGANYASLFIDPRRNVSPRHIAAALPVLLGALAFYYWIVPYTNSDTGLAVLVVPTLIFAGHCLKLGLRRTPGQTSKAD